MLTYILHKSIKPSVILMKTCCIYREEMLIHHNQTADAEMNM